MIGFLLRVVIGLVLMLTFSVCVQAAEAGHELGRVFLSPTERATLDKERAEHYSPTISEPVTTIPRSTANWRTASRTSTGEVIL